jgi:hypothetical protein
MLNEVFKYTEGHNGGSSYNDKIPGFGVKHNWVKKSVARQKIRAASVGDFFIVV